MQKLRQTLLPLNRFGLAESLLSHAQVGLAPRDIPTSEIAELCHGVIDPIFRTSLLERPDTAEVLSLIVAHAKGTPRLILSLGQEWEIFGERALQLQSQGWGLDLVLDRPATQVAPPTGLLPGSDFRWILSPLRFYRVEEISDSLPQSELPPGPQYFCFLEPTQSQSLLPSADEVVLLQASLEQREDLGPVLTPLILVSPFASEKSFFNDPRRENYQTSFRELSPERRFKNFFLGLFETLPWLASLLAFLIENSLLNPATWSRLAWPLFKIYWFFEYQYQKRLRPWLVRFRRDD